MDFISKNKLIAAVVVVVIAGIAWFFLSGSSPSTDSVLTTQVSAVPPDALELIASLNTLRNVSLNAGVFTNPAFQALQDFSTPIVTEPLGRTNPFAPFEGAPSNSQAL